MRGQGHSQPFVSTVLHLQNQPTMDQKYLGRKFQKAKEKNHQNLNLLGAGNCLHSIYIVFTTNYFV